MLIPGFYRVGLPRLKQAMQNVLPPTLYLWGTESNLGGTAFAKEVTAQTGTGDDGNGGAASGQVKSAWIEGASHIIPLSVPLRAAEEISRWLLPEVERRKETNRQETQQPAIEPGILNPLWQKAMSKL